MTWAVNDIHNDIESLLNYAGAQETLDRRHGQRRFVHVMVDSIHSVTIQLNQ